MRRYGNKIYYGDASRPELLRAAGAERAKVLVLAIDDMQASVETAKTVKELFPNLKVYARARNRYHAHQLMERSQNHHPRAVFLEPAYRRGTPQGAGVQQTAGRIRSDTFRRHDETTLEKQYSLRGDEAAMIQSTKEAADELRDLFEADPGPDE